MGISSVGLSRFVVLSWLSFLSFGLFVGLFVLCVGFFLGCGPAIVAFLVDGFMYGARSFPFCAFIFPRMLSA